MIHPNSPNFTTNTVTAVLWIVHEYIVALTLYWSVEVSVAFVVPPWWILFVWCPAILGHCCFADELYKHGKNIMRNHSDDGFSYSARCTLILRLVSNFDESNCSKDAECVTGAKASYDLLSLHHPLETVFLHVPLFLNTSSCKMWPFHPFAFQKVM